MRWDQEMGFASYRLVWAEKPQFTVGMEGGRGGGTTLTAYRFNRTGDGIFGRGYRGAVYTSCLRH